MNDLISWLRSTLDAAEAKALAATPGPWWHDPGKQWLGPDAFERYDRTKGEEFVGYGGPSPFTGCVAATGPASHAQSMSDAAFIADNDPARVLRQVAAQRSILNLCAAAMDAGQIKPGTTWNDDAAGAEVAEAAVRLLAEVYADRPGYREEWRP